MKSPLISLIGMMVHLTICRLNWKVKDIGQCSRLPDSPVGTKFTEGKDVRCWPGLNVNVASVEFCTKMVGATSILVVLPVSIVNTNKALMSRFLAAVTVKDRLRWQQLHVSSAIFPQK